MQLTSPDVPSHGDWDANLAVLEMQTLLKPGQFDFDTAALELRLEQSDNFLVAFGKILGGRSPGC